MNCPETARFGPEARTLTLADFLLARIAEDEAVAQGCIDEIGGGRAGEPWEDGSGDRDSDDFPSYPWGSGARELAYMARTQPARVLAECEAKRYLCDLYDAAAAHGRPLAILTELLIRFAAPYSDHPDYRAEWRP